MVTQKDAVLKAITKFGKAGLTEEAKAKIYAHLERDFKAGKIELRPTEANLNKLADAKLLRLYVIGLVSNWIRKDPRLKKAA